MIGRMSIAWVWLGHRPGFCLVPSRFDAHALWIAPMPCPLCRRSAMLCSDLLWDAQSVSRKQVPTLQDAFLCCDRETLLSMVEQGYARRLPGWGQATPQQRRVARKRMGRALEAMLDCAVKRKSGKSPMHIPRRALRRACAAGPGMHRAFGAGARGGSVCGRCAARCRRRRVPVRLCSLVAGSFVSRMARRPLGLL